MSNNPQFVNIDLTPEYRNNLKKLAKKYRNIRSDTQGLIEKLQKGLVLGDRLSGFGDNCYVYKVRAKNSNIQKGKSGGYRIIYLLESKTSILLLTIYSKSEQEDITTEQVKRILDNFEEVE